MGFKINSYTHHNNHDNCKLTISPNYPEFRTEIRFINKIVKKYLFFMLD